jgi:hypothetical protein
LKKKINYLQNSVLQRRKFHEDVKADDLEPMHFFIYFDSPKEAESRELRGAVAAANNIRGDAEGLERGATPANMCTLNPPKDPEIRSLARDKNEYWKPNV